MKMKKLSKKELENVSGGVLERLTEDQKKYLRKVLSCHNLVVWYDFGETLFLCGEREDLIVEERYDIPFQKNATTLDEALNLGSYYGYGRDKYEWLNYTFFSKRLNCWIMRSL